MAQEVKEEQNKNDTGLTVSFIAADKKQWIFKKVSDKEVVFSIDSKSYGKITKIEYVDSDRGLTVKCEHNSTEKTSLNENGASIVNQLQGLCPPGLVTTTKPITRRLMARMLAAVNGRCNFEPYSPLMTRERPESCQEITRELLVKMLKRENDIRLSKDMLEALEKESSEYEDNDSCSADKLICARPHIPLTIVQCQEKVVQEFGYKTNAEISYAIQTLRSACALFPNDVEIQNAAFYLKYNRAHRGELKVNDGYKDVPLMTCAQEETKLSEILNPEKATVIISGSVT